MSEAKREADNFLVVVCPDGQFIPLDMRHDTVAVAEGTLVSIYVGAVAQSFQSGICAEWHAALIRDALANPPTGRRVHLHTTDPAGKESGE